MPNSSQTEQSKEPPTQKAPTVSAEKPKEVIVSEVQLYEYLFFQDMCFYIIKLVHFVTGGYCFRLLHRLAPNERELWRRER